MPRAVVHKKILDVAEARPDAPLETIADEVSGATVSIVEQVLEEYGDPGAADGEPESESGDDESESAADEEGESGDAGNGAGSGDADEPNGSVDFESGSGSGSDPGPDPDSDSEPELESEDESGDESAGDESVENESDRTDAASSGAADDGDGDPTTEPDESSETTPEVTVAPSDVTEKQLETFRAIYDRPDATQTELAEQLGVSAATISQRVNAVDGFEWSNRRAFVEALFDGGDRSPPASDRPESERERASVRDDCDPADEAATERNVDELEARDDVAALAQEVRRLAQRLETLEARLAEAPTDETLDDGVGLSSDPELAHKVIRACFSDDAISEDEELRILQSVTAVGADGA